MISKQKLSIKKTLSNFSDMQANGGLISRTAKERNPYS
jgi:hypothetical protein